MRRVLICFPTAWDHKHLASGRGRWLDDFTVELAEPSDADCPDDFDVLAWIDAAVARGRGDLDGVMSSSDYPGATVAAALGTALGLPACPPAASMAAAHKGLSRARQAECAADATPRFWQLDPDRLDPALLETLPYPCFVKPAKGAFSVLARRVADAGALAALLRSPEVAAYRHHYLAIYADLVRRYLGDDVDPRAFVAEELISGRLVTVEGFVTGSEARILGVVDSVVDATTGSFIGFEYPSRLPRPAQDRLEDVARRVAEHLGLRWTLFNVELMWDEIADVVRVVEINVRMCGQFADLYEKVDGAHGFHIALQLACGDEPRFERGGGEMAVAVSYPLRVFTHTRVGRAPDDADIAAAESLFPGTRIWNEVTGGDLIDDFGHDDGKSFRYAVVNLGAPSRDELAGRLGEVVARLGYDLQPLA